MNAPLRRVGVVVLVLFGLLFANLNWVQAYKANEYRTSPYNGRVQVAEYERQRGVIEAEGKALARSTTTNGELKYLRGYPFKELYAHVVGLAERAGWEFGGPHSGHLVGEFPHEQIDGERIESYIAPGSDHPMRRTDAAGRRAHWILEIHLVDRGRSIGGFFEQLLTLRH